MKKRSTLYIQIVKPVLDWVTALIVLLLCSPLLVLTMIVLAVSNRGKVWFVQDRPGRQGRIFRIIKFKTMRDAIDASGQPLPDNERLTLAGRIVRKASLDELPQLFNVLSGDMSIVGPRPLLVEYLPLYSKEQMERHAVKPGITGWAQVNGRNQVEWKERFEMDVWYARNVNFMLDMKILALTLVKVFRAEGISGRTSVTMEKFSGN